MRSLVRLPGLLVAALLVTPRTAAATPMTVSVELEPPELVSHAAGVVLKLGDRELTDAWGLPLVPITVDLPAGAVDVTVEIEPLEPLELQLAAPLVVPPVVTAGEGAPGPRGARVAPAPDARELSTLSAATVVRQRVAHRHGVAVAQLVVRPVAVRESDGAGIAALTAYRRLELRIEPKPARAASMAAGAVTPRAWDPSLPRAEQPFAPPPHPTLDGSPVEYVIVTSELLRPEFERLAAWRTQSGVRATVRTVEWIDGVYRGADGAARVREFLRDAYQAWGARQVLLGGDTDQVPARYLISRYFVANPETDLWEIPADVYYAGLDGDWNSDGDHLYGEESDAVDLLPELELGRAPVSTIEEARLFVSRQLAYEFGHGVREGYPDEVLFLAEVLFRQPDGTPAPGFDGAEFAERVADLLPPELSIVRHYESDSSFPHDVDLSPAGGQAAFNEGAGLVLHVGHGFRNTLSLGSGSISNPDVDALQNGQARPLVLALNCSSAAFDFNAIGERFFKSPRGGAVSYIGMSRFAFPTTAAVYQEWFVRQAYAGAGTTVGEAMQSTREQFWTLDMGDLTPHRYTQYTLTVLGDPMTPLFPRHPQPLIVRHQPSVPLGTPEVRVEVLAGAQPISGARVALSNRRGDLATGSTDAAGVVLLPNPLGEQGLATVTATAPGHLPAISSLCTSGTNEAFPNLEALAVISGSLTAGASAELEVLVRNLGGSSWPASEVSLAVVSGPATAVATQAPLAELAPGARARAAGLLLDVDSGARDGEQLILEVGISAGGETRVFRRALAVGAAELVHLAQNIEDSDGDGAIEPGEEVRFQLVLGNRGGGIALGVEATANVIDRATGLPSAQATMEWSQSRFGDLAPSERSTGEPVIFTLAPDADPALLALEVAFNRPLLDPRTGEVNVVSARLDFVPPQPPTGLIARGSASSIRLTWTPADAVDLLGYEVERSLAQGGPFEVVTPDVLMAGSLLEDGGLAALTEYVYRVRSVDVSRNRSTASETVVGVTNPPQAAGWPISVGQETATSVLLQDLDGDGVDEILAGGDAMYVWHGDGREWRDGDANATTSGVFSTDGVVVGKKGYHAAPAVADIDLDGELEIIGAAWEDANLYVWKLDGTRLDGWPRSLIGPPNWGSPVVADLDGDGDFEVAVVSGNRGRLFAWHHDGGELIDGDGNPATHGVLFDSGASFSFATPAAADLDGIPGMELIIGFDEASGTLHAFKTDGSEASGWPRALGGRISASPAVADLDGDSAPEVLVAVEDDSVHVLGADGIPLPGWPLPAVVENASARTSSPIAVDLDGAGTMEVVFAANNGRMHVWHSDGAVVLGWENVRFAQNVDAQSARATQSTPVVGDVDGDGGLDVLLGAEDGRLYGWSAGGAGLPGFPIQTGGELRGSAAVSDVDGDGLLELAIAGWDKNLYVWSMTGIAEPSRTPWPSFRSNPRNTGAVGQAGGGSPAPAPSQFQTIRLFPPYPNPLTGLESKAAIEFELELEERVSLAIYDVSGRLVTPLVNRSCAAGGHCVYWDGRDQRGVRVASGIYWLELTSPSSQLRSRIVVMH